ncbi:MAG: DinB family protein [Saprospiraceae bacterium]
MDKKAQSNRRNFIKKSAIATGSLMTITQASWANPITEMSKENLNIIGPKKGFTPQVGTLVSMMNFMRDIVLRPVYGMSVRDLDFLLDDKSNSIGAMLWHLAAVERFYQENTFDGKKWDNLPAKESKLWNAASDLGDKGRAKIKGYSLDFYLDLLKDVRAFSIAEMKTRDDDWLMKESHFWGGPMNNYAKWFHVVEHESNHNGQFKYIKNRIK